MPAFVICAECGERSPFDQTRSRATCPHCGTELRRGRIDPSVASESNKVAGFPDRQKSGMVVRLYILAGLAGLLAMLPIALGGEPTAFFICLATAAGFAVAANLVDRIDQLIYWSRQTAELLKRAEEKRDHRQDS